MLLSVQSFVRRSRVPAPVEELDAWHRRRGALERLTPPWEHVEVLSDGAAGEPGSRRVLRVGRIPLRTRWVAEHWPLDDARGFRDVQIEGPFAQWRHEHRFESAGPDASVLEDRVEYALPLGLLGRAAAGRRVRRRLERAFAYRHRTVAGDLAALGAAGPERPHVAVTGASGLVGSALVPFLTAGGHEVTKLVRRPPEVGAPEVRWDPEGFVDTDGLADVDAVVHLAGENIFARWTEEKKEAIRESRARGTRVLARELAGMEDPPDVLVSASGINYYGDGGEQRLDEEAAAGEGFLAGVCREWEEAASEASAAGIRVVRLRFGVVLTPEGGALALMLPAFRLGLGGPVGDGGQWMSWITRDDLVGAIHRAVTDDGLAGPVNAVAPHPVRNRELTSALGRVLGRPTLLRVPEAAVRALAGQMGEETILASIRAVPSALEGSGHRFRHPGVEEALRHLLGRTTDGPS